MRIVKIEDSDSFIDVLYRLAPAIQAAHVVSVLLKQTRKTPDADATDTRDLGANVKEVSEMVRATEGIDPAVLTYVVSVTACRAEDAEDGAQHIQINTHDVVRVHFRQSNR